MLSWHAFASPPPTILLEPNMQDHIQPYFDHLEKSYLQLMDLQDSVQAEMHKDFVESLRFIDGKKYIKILTKNSAHSFIVKEDGPKFRKGDILKAASWAAPATNFARGNILTKEYRNIRWCGA